MQRFSFLLIFLLLTVGAAFADDTHEPIVPERPGFTNGTDITLLGTIQFETGYVYSSDHGDRTRVLGDGSLLSLPLHHDLELRFGLPGYEWADGIKGFNDSSVSLKYRFLRENPKQKLVPILALIGGVELPTGIREFREDDYQPALALEADWNLTERYGVTADLKYNAIRESGQRFNEWGGGVCLNVNVSPLWGTFAEIYRIADTGVGETHQNFVDTGATYRIGSNLIFDINGGVGVLGTHSQWFYGGGIAQRW